MGQDNGDSKLPERENMGWLATSAVPAKRRRLIEGISGRGVIELQAQLYRTQEHAKQRGEGLVDVRDKHVRRKAGVDVMALRNAGVEGRDARDKEQQQRRTGQGAERLAESAAALARKAELYDALARGELEDEQDRYEVDFFRKGGTWADEEQQQQEEREQTYRQRAGPQSHPEQHHYSHQQQQQQQGRGRPPDDDEDDWHPGHPSSSRQPPAAAGHGQRGPDSWEEAAGRWGQGRQGGWAALDTAAAAVGGSGAMRSADMDREQERRRWEEQEEARLQREEEQAARRAEHKAQIKQLSAQTEASRSRAAALRAQREAAAADKRAALKAAFLQGQLAKALGGRQHQQQQQPKGPG